MLINIPCVDVTGCEFSNVHAISCEMFSLQKIVQLNTLEKNSFVRD